MIKAQSAIACCSKLEQGARHGCMCICVCVSWADISSKVVILLQGNV